MKMMLPQGISRLSVAAIHAGINPAHLEHAATVTRQTADQILQALAHPRHTKATIELINAAQQIPAPQGSSQGMSKEL
jgi:hypothetical protein